MKKNYWYKKIIACFIGLALLSGSMFIITLLVLVLKRKPSLSLCLPILLIILGLVVGIIYYGYSKIINPINKLQHTFHLFNRGYIFDELFRSNYFMSESMEKTFEKLQEICRERNTLSMAEQQIEYLTLQSQINPHFLYNTLDSIRTEALLGNTDAVSGMTEALSKFFRYAITQKDSLVPLQTELDNIRNYILIQKYRFNDRIQLCIEYDETDIEIMKCQVLKLTLQPLIENAFEHGLANKLGGGTITITIEHSRKNLFIYIKDNGIGIEKESVDQLNEMFQSHNLQTTATFSKKKSGIALANINNRIKMYFGLEYGLHITSTKNLGTSVRITLPSQIIYKKQ